MLTLQYCSPLPLIRTTSSAHVQHIRTMSRQFLTLHKSCYILYATLQVPQQQHCLASAFAAQSRKRTWPALAHFSIRVYLQSLYLHTSHSFDSRLSELLNPWHFPRAGSAMYQALIPSTHVLQLAAVLKHRSLSNAVQSSTFNYIIYQSTYVSTLNMTPGQSGTYELEAHMLHASVSFFTSLRLFLFSQACLINHLLHASHLRRCHTLCHIFLSVAYQQLDQPACCQWHQQCLPAFESAILMLVLGLR